MITLAQLVRSYGMGLPDLSTVVGIDGVDPSAELSEGQTKLVMELVENCDLFGRDTSRHRLPAK